MRDIHITVPSLTDKIDIEALWFKHSWNNWLGQRKMDMTDFMRAMQEHNTIVMNEKIPQVVIGTEEYKALSAEQLNELAETFVKGLGHSVEPGTIGFMRAVSLFKKAFRIGESR